MTCSAERNRTAFRPIPFPYIDQQITYSFVATVENVAVRFVPTVPSTVTAATAMRAAIRPYSIAVAPSSFFKSLDKVANILGLHGR